MALASAKDFTYDGFDGWMLDPTFKKLKEGTINKGTAFARLLPPVFVCAAAFVVNPHHSPSPLKTRRESTS